MRTAQTVPSAGKERNKRGAVKRIMAGTVCIGLLAAGVLTVLGIPKGGEQEEESAVDLAQKREERILALSEQQWMLEQAARNLVADRLAATSFVTVEPREQFSTADVILDGVTGNLIISEGARAMYQSIAEGRTMPDICRNTLESAAAQTPQYLSDKAEDVLQGMVTDLIGVDVFSALDFISQLRNADDLPVVLLQQIVNEQQRDVYRLTLFLEQNEVSAADMYKIAQLMYAVRKREQEITAVRGTVAGGSETDCQDMRTLAGQYAANETELLYLAQTETLETLDETGENAFADGWQSISDKLEIYSVLAESEQGDIAVNYDVEGFREAQKTVSQAGTVGRLLTGELLGGFLAEGGQQNEDWLQENRAELCDRMTDYMEESYLEVASARAVFMGQYGVLRNLVSAPENDRDLAERYLEYTPWEVQLDEAAKVYLTALSRYKFDLESAYILYDCMLTGNQADFLFALTLETEQTERTLQSFQGVEYEGYSEEEKADRWCALLESYKQLLDQTIDRSLAVGGNAPGVNANGSLTVYGETTYQAYTKDFAADSKPLTIVGGTGMQERNPRYYYDTSGNLLYVSYGINKIIYRNNTPVVFVVGENKKYPWNLEPDGWELQRMSEYTAKAQDMYNRFVSGAKNREEMSCFVQSVEMRYRWVPDFAESAEPY